MRPFTSTIPFDEALRIVLGDAAPIARTEVVPIDDADGRVVATDVIAGEDVPAFDRAAMDGYAVVAADTIAATHAVAPVLTCVGRAFGGEMPRPIARGECLEVATGAPMPHGADAVVMVEQSVRDGDRVRILAATSPGQHIGRRGADIARGRAVLPAGTVLTPARLGAASALGKTTIEVFAKPAVAIASSGPEVVMPGQPLAPGQVYDINRTTVSAAVMRHGGVTAPFANVRDSVEDLVALLDAASACDIIVLSGGSSVGDHDLTIDAIRARGEVLFHGIAVRPGKPVVFARIGQARVFGLPGYPASCLSSTYTLLVPFLRAVARLPPWEPRTVEVPLARRVTSAAGRHQFYSVRVAGGKAEPAFKASGDITSLADADGYIEIPAPIEAIDAGTMVTVKLF
jgi:molybdenum cofactor synthesis domain-containing protein